MTDEKLRRWSTGSSWIRIDPHLHTPYTLRNDNFGPGTETERWDKYVEAVNSAMPAASILGITDYGTLRSFKKVWSLWRDKRLPHARLLLANVELRLAIQAQKGAAVNAHLLLPVESEASLLTFEGKLAGLTFQLDGETFRCTDSDLIRLGRHFRRNAGLEEQAALRIGSEQFKVEVSALRELKGEKWFADNAYIALPSGDDGLKGVGHDDAFSAVRESLFGLCDIVLSSNPNDREFWLGTSRPEVFKTRGYSRKPCLHGCDAHELAEVLRPKSARLCFVRATLSADGFRQVTVEPERRVHIGTQPPAGPPAGEVIRRVRFENATWLTTTPLELNPGLVAVIGARGSGKTALADSIALAASALDGRAESASFLSRAGDLAAGMVVTLEWGDGTTTTGAFPGSIDGFTEPRVQYLSQKFVETLCLPQGLAEPLLDELDRIVFAHLPTEARNAASSFGELRGLLVAQSHAKRSAALQQIQASTLRIAQETARKAKLVKLNEERVELTRQQLALKQQLGTFVTTGSEENKKALETTTVALEKLRRGIGFAEQKTRRLGAALQAVENFEKEFSARFLALTQDFADLASVEEWRGAAPSDLSDARALLERKKIEAEALSSGLKERGAVPEGIPLEKLVAEVSRLTQALGLDEAAAKKRAFCELQLRNNDSLLEKKRSEIAEAEGASERIATAGRLRLDSYADCVAALDDEVECLAALYDPLRERLSQPSLRKLSFHVHRDVDVREWAERGEQLLDLRKRSPFPAGSSLLDVAESRFLRVWREGSPAEVRAVMQVFVDEYAIHLAKILAAGVDHRQLGDWLFSLEHVSVRYVVRYEGVDLQHLSPGTRGVVLLTLYLALDDSDQRPLVIDQPEENLDPKSVHAELVGFFRTAAQRRQVIMVTHNANLVVNTDADQVITATSERAAIGGLPNISYEAGGLEESWVREGVCGLLEGGREAFAARARRYGGPPQR